MGSGWIAVQRLLRDMGRDIMGASDNENSRNLELIGPNWTDLSIKSASSRRPWPVLKKIMIRHMSQWDNPDGRRDDPQIKGLESENNLGVSLATARWPSSVEGGL